MRAFSCCQSSWLASQLGSQPMQPRTCRAGLLSFVGKLSACSCGTATTVRKLAIPSLFVRRVFLIHMVCYICLRQGSLCLYEHALLAGGLDVQGCALALAPLMGSLTDRQCRAAGCAAFAALSQLDAGLGDAAALLTSLDAWSASQVGHWWRCIAQYNCT